MKLLVSAFLAVALVSCGTEGSHNVSIKTEQDSVSYAIGMDIGKTMKTQSIQITPDVFARGIADASGDSTKIKPLLTDDQIRGVLMAFQARMQQKQMETASKKAAEDSSKAQENIKKEAEFLAKNKDRQGVTTLPSGLQYEVLKEGSGPIPTAQDEVKVHYKGTTLDGTTFDSSYDRGEPATFQVTGVIPGWTQALELMKVGSKWKVYIPAVLAYGQNVPQGAKFGPNEMLTFEMELIEIVKK